MAKQKKFLKGAEKFLQKFFRKKEKEKMKNCETCEFYDYDEYLNDYVCKVDLDEDEYLDYLLSKNKDCPYYKYYDEYKSVQKQN